MQHKKVPRALVVIFILSLIICGSGYYLLFTTSGSSFLVKFILSRALQSKSISIKTIEGNLIKGFSLQDIAVEDIEKLPPASTLKVKKVDMSVKSLSLEGININIHNGTLKFPASAVLLFYGTHQKGSLDFNAYSKHINVEEILGFFPQSSNLKKLSGAITELDIYAKGSFSEPELSGKFIIKEISHNGFSVVNCPGSFHLNLKGREDNFKLYGEVLFTGGTVSGHKTATVALEPSKISFAGKPQVPRFDLKGTSSIEGVKITVRLKGTIEKPDLQLTSAPPLPSQKLLLMLATGKSWKGTEAAIKEGVISTDVVKDFIDYFVFSGSGSKLAEKLGVKEFSIRFDKDARGLGVKKDISEKAEVSYGVEQSQIKEKATTTTHKVGVEYKITDSVSVGVEKELEQESKTPEDQEKSKANGKVLLKFKKEF
ncbi:MAG: translocation/assembly module TamB domain-containing protein [Candidatus Omnitrophota bacterium]|nr:MAG: translocation/assembly module TamB domain-containing protein [Candidatus Omnitrophota bacterium]